MQIIAENLVELSKEKQVVIFTHNLVFLGFIKAIIDKDESLQHYKFFTTERAEVDGKLYVGKVTETANPSAILKWSCEKIGDLSCSLAITSLISRFCFSSPSSRFNSVSVA